MCQKYVFNSSTNRRRACLRVGSWSVQERTGDWLLRRREACAESRGRSRFVERLWNISVSLWPCQIHPTLKVVSFRVIGVPSSTAYILTYDHLLNTALPPLMENSSLIPLTAGVIARGTISTIASPLELIRTNLQSTPISSKHPHTLKTVLSSLRSLMQQQGTLYLWRGLAPTLWRDVTFSGYYWASYEATKKEFAKHGHTGAWIAFFSGAVSGTSAALLTSPFDVLKTRRQALLMSGSAGKMTGTISLLYKIIRTEGASALFAGLSPRVAKIAPACGIMISCYEVRYVFPSQLSSTKMTSGHRSMAHQFTITPGRYV